MVGLGNGRGIARHSTCGNKAEDVNGIVGGPVHLIDTRYAIETMKVPVFPAGEEMAMSSPPQKGPSTPSLPSSDIRADSRAEVGQASGFGGVSDEPRKPEERLWSGRTHWKHFAGTLLVWLLLNVVFLLLLVLVSRRWEWLSGGVATMVFVALWLLNSIEFIGRRVAWRILQKGYRLTSERLFIEIGVLSRTVDQTELVRVDDVRVHQSLMDRVFGLGSVEVVSTDATDRNVMIEGIADPDRVAEMVRENMRSLRRKSLFVENL